MSQFDWTPISHFVLDPPMLVDGRCDNCGHKPFYREESYTCNQCGTRWTLPDLNPVCYKDWSGADVDGLPVLGRKKRGLGIYR